MCGIIQPTVATVQNQIGMVVILLTNLMELHPSNKFYIYPLPDFAK